MEPFVNVRLAAFLLWLFVFTVGVVGTMASAKIIVSKDAPASWNWIALVCLPLNSMLAVHAVPKAYREAKEYVGE